jgi:ribosomal 50S subunit-associated protein YjgA (DUF615 family)
MDLQQTAEQVIDLEAGIINWRGNAAGWMKELSRLGEAIESLEHDTLDGKDPIQEEFLKCLQHKTNCCRERVLKRADRIDAQNEPGFLSYYDNPAPAVTLCGVK